MALSTELRAQDLKHSWLTIATSEIISNFCTNWQGQLENFWI
ncbi:MAG TPA: hypothetical protein VK184_03690 [Nostocaceae cyanobacterium]|nr:hypothetical protein [Nostocaceae cyanobacterium]